MAASNPNHLNALQRWLLLVICILPIVGWAGILENYSAVYVDNALKGAGIIYTTARGINALVSVLQGTELDAVMLTFTIGELLDPVNDLIERFSGIMLFALGSLAVQKILLELVSHTAFNSLLTLIAIATAFALLFGKHKIYEIFFKSFILMAVLRFSLGLVVIANGWVDMIFLEENDKQRHETMVAFKDELREISSMTGVHGPSPELIDEARIRVDKFEKARASEQRDLHQSNSKLEQAEKRLSALSGERPWWEIWNPLDQDTPQIAKAKAEVQKLEAKIKTISLFIQYIDENLVEQREALKCMERRANGLACGLIDRITSKLSPSEIGLRIDALMKKMTEFSDRTIELLMSALLKSVVIPLFFFYLVLKIVRTGWSQLP
ncbi:MAG: hypothetical protein DRR42_13970 [Gammaproteobacteria bacterium]|nr:MAG: hypothetical protein DRR42_13970 [Gammaproteobacteria bacterium]